MTEPAFEVLPMTQLAFPQNPVIVLPTYNEAENLPQMLETLRREVRGAHILVVDDNSPDGTGAIAAKAAEVDQQIRVLHRNQKDGLGKAYLAGFDRALEAGHDAVVQMDCDFSHDPSRVPALLKTLTQGADLAIGSRYVKGGGTVGWGMRRKIISAGGSFYARTILGMPYRDLTGGFKAWRADALRGIDFGAVESRGYSFQIEMTYRAHRAGKRIEEVPIVFEDRVAGDSKMNGAIALEAMRMCWWLRWRVR